MSAVVAVVALMSGALALVPSAPASATQATGTGATSIGTGYAPAALLSPAALDAPATSVFGASPASGLYSATPTELASLQNLEQEAIANTISDHGLSYGDGQMVASWARPDAQAELWALLVAAVQAVGAGTATTDQQNAVSWLSDVERRESVISADAAGLEYAKWAGLGTTQYNALVNVVNPSESAVQSYLSTTPEPYTDGGSATDPAASSNGGYCVFQPPAPYQSQYTGGIYGSTPVQTCFTGCTNVLGCNPPTPTYNQFVQWGSVDANEQLFSNPGFATAAQNIALSASLGTVASAAAGLGTIAKFALGSTLGGTSFQTTVFPFASQYGPDYTVNAAAAAEASGQDAEVAVQGAIDMATEEGGIVAASGVGAIFGSVIFAVSTAVEEGINVFNAAALPGQLATLVADAPTTTPNVESMLSSSSGAQSLYSVFVGATQPPPTYNTCDNTLPSSTPTITVLGVPAQCLNATPVPAESSLDPQWVVTPQGSTTSTTQPTVTFTNSATQLTATTYLHGDWFVSSGTVSGTSATVQGLQLHYTDWSGNQQTAWLLPTTAGSPEFLVVPSSTVGPSFDPTTCISSSTCALTPSIDLVGPTGNDLSASVSASASEPPPVPVDPQPTTTTTTVTVSPANPTVGQTITLTATIAPYNMLLMTGTVDFGNGRTDLCANVPFQAVPTSTTTPGGLTVTTYSAQATCTTTFTGNPEYFFATYSGDSSGDAPSQGELTVAAPVPTTTVVTESPAGPVVGQPVNLTATVSDSSPGLAPTGTVTFVRAGTTVCTDVPLSTLAPYTASCHTAFVVAGGRPVQAHYSGATGTEPSDGSLVVSVAPPVPTLTTVVVSPSTNLVVGQPVDLVATVADLSPGVAPMGRVTFDRQGTAVCSDVPLSGSGPYTATCRTAFQGAGGRQVQAHYSGAIGTDRSDASLVVVVAQAASALRVLMPPQVVVGQSVTYSAQVILLPPDVQGPAPMGQVTFSSVAGNMCSVALPAGAPSGIPITVSCDYSFRAAGPETITVSYSGGPNTRPSQSVNALMVQKALTAASLSASANPIFSKQSVRFNTTVSPVAPSTRGPLPTGTVTFQVDGRALGSPVALVDGRAESPYTSTLSLGKHAIDVFYSGDANYAPSRGSLVEIVNPAG